MTSSSATFVRLAAAGVIALLVAALPAAPATAAPTEPLHAAVAITARVLYPSDDSTPGPPGTSEDAPADAGPEPALLRVRVEVTNVGTEPLGDFHFYDRHVTNGVQDGFQCDLDPSWSGISEPDFALDPGRSFTCTETYSEIKQGTLHESIRSVGAFGLTTQEGVTETAHVWAEAGPPAPPSTPPPAVSIGHRVWIDTNRNQQWDPGEPGVPGVHVSLRLGFLEPRPANGFLSAETTTDKDGIYHFDDVEPGVRYTVLVDLGAPGLKNTWLVSPPFDGGGGGTTASADTSRSIYTYDAMNFGFVPKDRLVFDIDAPTTAAAGTSIDVLGRLYPAAKPEEWGDTPRGWSSVPAGPVPGSRSPTRSSCTTTGRRSSASR